MLDEERDLVVVMHGQIIGPVHVQGRGARLLYRRTGDGPEAVGAGTPLSLSMPLTKARYHGPRLRNWIEGLLPDRPETLVQWRRQFGVRDVSPLSLIRHVGEDVAGAAQFVRPSRVAAVMRGAGAAVPLDEAQIGEMLRRASAHLPAVTRDPSAEPAGGVGESAGKFSLAGAQAKTALHRLPGGEWADPVGAIPSTHIIKPAIPGMEDQDLVEHVTMRTARSVGLRVAPTTVRTFDGVRALVVERFDRLPAAGRVARVHQEDMCQALGVWPGSKYETEGGPSAADVADLIARQSTSKRRSAAPSTVDNEQFVSALIFSWLTGGTDAHARNYSLLLSGADVRLAPLYDLNSHLAYSSRGMTLCMAISGEFRAARVTRAHWARAAPDLHVTPAWVEREIERQVAVLPRALLHAIVGSDVAEVRTSPTIMRMAENLATWIDDRAR